MAPLDFPTVVLIESDWNLKIICAARFYSIKKVLIESDWNLKKSVQAKSVSGGVGINRIRLEFKGIFLLLIEEI